MNKKVKQHQSSIVKSNSKAEQCLIERACKAIVACELKTSKMLVRVGVESFSCFYDRIGHLLEARWKELTNTDQIAHIALLALGPGQTTKYRALSIARYPANRGSLEQHLETGGFGLIRYVALLTLAAAVYEVLTALKEASATSTKTASQPALIRYVNKYRW